MSDGLPDFIIIGAMKSGTTTLFRWLGEHPLVQLPTQKEPGFFSNERKWEHGVDWYRSIFPSTAGRPVTGEASARYTFLPNAATCAERMMSVVPHVKVIYVVREPIDRLRSHYRHEVQRGRERRSPEDALLDPDSAYVACSRYWSCLRPYVDRFSKDQILVVSSAELFERMDGWARVLGHLGLPVVAAPRFASNRSDDKPAYRAAMTLLWNTGGVPSVRWLPSPVRRTAKALLTRRARPQVHPEPIVPQAIQDLLRDETATLERWRGGQPLFRFQQPTGVAGDVSH
jgi:hypothetical protein